MKYAVIDLSNLFSRARHVAKDPDPYIKAGLAVHIVFRSMRKMYRELKVDHMVFAVDAGSWRYDVYPMYKAKRKLARATATATEQEENEIFYSMLNTLVEYLTEKTRCTVLNCRGIEGDDFVARWIQLHPDDEHVIVSGDSDFVQLLSPTVSIYDGVNERWLTSDGVKDASGKKLAFEIDTKNGKVKVKNVAPKDFVPEEDWWKKALFLKIVRGDAGDGIFSAYPGITYKGSSKRIGIAQAWEDRKNKEYYWNNFFLQEWKKSVGDDENGNPQSKSVRVIDEYRINESLIDLTKQPDEIKDKMDLHIAQTISKPAVANVGFHFLKFCGKHDFKFLSDEPDHCDYLGKSYPTIKE